MAEHLSREVQTLCDTVALSFHGLDFESYRGGSEEGVVIDGSVRYKSGYDAYAGCSVNVYEFVGAVADGHGVERGHRIMAAWENGQDCDFCVDTGTFLLEENDEGSLEVHLEDNRWLYTALLRAIEAVGV